MRWLRIFFLILLAIATTYVANHRLGPLPALGDFLSPYRGVWRNAEPLKTKSTKPLKLVGLNGPIDIVVDSRGVPHIFATSEPDLYFAQGFMTARDRLWQMDIVTREAGGRLSEVLGSTLLNHDLVRRRYGLRKGAEAMLAAFQRNTGTQRVVEAYANGVNAYLASISPSQWPLEFKLLGYAPEKWTPFKSALLLKSLQWTLSAGSDDFPLTATLGKFGPQFFREFFPGTVKDMPPVIPPTTTWPKSWQSQPMVDTAATDSLKSLKLDDTVATPKADSFPGENENIPLPYHGSNNFVLASKRTADGHPILGNDPHLELTLPSTWYEMQLKAPGINVYGVSVPGAPAIIIGFNDSAAWGLTNGKDDVYDWYRIDFRDTTLAEYRFNNKWLKTSTVIETVYVREAKTVFDTVIYTHQGPVVWREPASGLGKNTPMLHALRWAGHDTSDEVGAFLRLASVHTVPQLREALTGFSCPSQNIAFATVTGDIAMLHQGHFPWKWKGQGRLILDGSNPKHDWQGWVPWDRNPSVENPDQGYLESANQNPVDTSYPYHLGYNFLNPDRAIRLDQILKGAHGTTLDSAFNYLLDNYNVHAARIVPALLSLLDTNSKDEPSKALLKQLQVWDFRYHNDSPVPTFFEAWWKTLYRGVWADDFGEDSVRYAWPNKAVTRQLILENPNSEWFDDVRTPTHENLRGLVNQSFRIAFSGLRSELGPFSARWNWSRQRPVSLPHLLRLGAFGRTGIQTGGCPDCIDAQRTSHGPSWRMVVSLTSPPTAEGIYPGGQSGNPGSPHYDDFISDWANHQRYTLNRYYQLPDRSDTSLTFLEMHPK